MIGHDLLTALRRLRRGPLVTAIKLAALAATLLIASLAVISQIWRAARVRPAEVLHHE